MIANAVTVAIGLWLAYSAIFSTPAGEMNNIKLVIAAAVIVVCALFARRSDRMNWQSSTSIALGLLLGLLAAARAYFDESPLPPFWIILLAGITIAIAALWSILYRRDQIAESI
jgi:hypothetical protein